MISQDAQWVDIDHMHEHLDWTVDQVRFGKLPSIVQSLHSRQMHFVPIIDMAIAANVTAGTYPPYELGLLMNVFMARHRRPAVGRGCS